MRVVLVILVTLLGYQFSVAQNNLDTAETELDSLYREDQFYFGVTYNLLGKLPNNMSQNGFSSGFHLGFIRDFPINEDRNFAVGLGLGISANSINQNLFISKDEQGNLNYELIESTLFTKNKFSQYLVEIPLELRWRTSTSESYKFWRIYTGFKIGYVFESSSKFNSSTGDVKLNNLDDFTKIQYGLTLSAGYNTWNVYLYYALNPMFKNRAMVNGETISVNAIKIGLMFFIL